MSEEVALLRQELTQHRRELSAHMELCDRKFDEGDKRMDLMLVVQQNQGEILRRIDTNTGDIVTWSNNIKGTIAIGAVAQRFALWLLKFGAFGAALVALGTYIYSKFAGIIE